MKKIIHLSDLHIGHDDCGLKFNEIVNNIILRMQPASDYVVVITGDLIDDANVEGMREEALAAINRLKEANYQVLCVPGNHDYGNGAWAKPKFVEIFKQTFYGNSHLTYPKVDVIDDIMFIGLDSTAGELNWYDRMFAEGEMGKSQLSRLKLLINDPKNDTFKKVVYFHHHPIDDLMWHKLKDSDKLRKIIENKVDALLFGHLHRVETSAVRDLNGKWGIKRVYNAASATHKNGNTGFHRVIDLYHEIDNDFDGAFMWWLLV